MIIVWFRQDLRLEDNPALHEAAKLGQVLPVYIFDESGAGDFKMGAASRWWLSQSLHALDKSLDGALQVYQGDSFRILKTLSEKHQAKAVYWNRCYEPWRIAQDTKIKKELSGQSFNGSLLWEPWEVRKSDGSPYKVFTPFFNNGCLKAKQPRKPLPKPKLNLFRLKAKTWDWAEPAQGWHSKLDAYWTPGEKPAHKRFDDFLDGELEDYAEARDVPSLDATSKMSPSLHFGEVSPNQLWWSCYPKHKRFLTELAWREFSYSLLYEYPDLGRKNIQSKFDAFPWKKSQKFLEAWQQGKTGFPIVDAGMRELWETGYMHNRVRMIVASFLVKNLGIHWHQGEDWFWDCLVDADMANNAASWQWVAGCGMDAAPYFRIFNPETQAKKFDPDDIYIKRWLGSSPRPKPIVDLSESRQWALEAYRKI